MYAESWTGRTDCAGLRTRFSILRRRPRVQAGQPCKGSPFHLSMDPTSAQAYWDRVAGEKHFQHQLRWEWIRAHVAGTDILDCGCGYGRLLEELIRRGYAAIGTDFSAAMLARCVATDPDLAHRLVQADSRALPFKSSSFNAVVAFTLLTSMPADSDQLALLREIRRILRPGGAVYLSDLLLNTDDRNFSRYQESAREFSAFGTFRLPEGVVLRHHSEEWIRKLTEGFTALKFERFTVTTMNGNPSLAFQYLGRLK
jgi:ubiquinone/menaquinone biosynthesis C-methylase UbiE